MADKDLLRISLIERVIAGEISANDAAKAQGLSLRQVRRQIRAFRNGGADGLVHGNRGRVSHLRTPEAVRSQALVLLEERYADYNTAHVRDMLANEHGIHLSLSTVARLRAELGQRSPRTPRTRHRP